MDGKNFWLISGFAELSGNIKNTANIRLTANVFANIWIREIIAENLKDEAKIRLLAVFNQVCNRSH